jgi:formylglycine-generating enzyme required for sulfatase activity
VSFEPGIVRIIVDGGEAGFAELMRVFVAAAQEYDEPTVVLRPTSEVVAGLVRIEPGPFLAGTPDVPENYPLRDLRTVVGRGFYVMEDEVSCAQYRAFALGSGRALPSDWPDPWDPRFDDLPAFSMTLDDAIAYAESVGLRLPTVWESQRMRRGTTGQLYPDGDTPPDDMTLHGLVAAPQPRIVDRTSERAGDEFEAEVRAYLLEHAQPVGTGPREGPAELRHLLGNLREWTETPDRIEGRPDWSSERYGSVEPGQYFVSGGDLSLGAFSFEDIGSSDRNSDQFLLGIRCVKSLGP